MKALYVLYDEQCGICRRLRVWLGQQRAYVEMRYIPLQSPELGCRFPGIEKYRPEQELVVVNEEGEVWRGESAWIVCLWALKEYREWALRLANPMLLPFARRVCLMVSENRKLLSRWFASEPLSELEQRLAGLPEPCATTGHARICVRDIR